MISRNCDIKTTTCKGRHGRSYFGKMYSNTLKVEHSLLYTSRVAIFAMVSSYIKSQLMSLTHPIHMIQGQFVNKHKNSKKNVRIYL